MNVIIIGVIAFLVGCGATYLISTTLFKSKGERLKKDAEAESEVIKKKKMLEAKEHFLQLKAEHEKVANERNSKLAQAESRIRQKETALSQRMEETQRKSRDIDNLRDNLKNQIEIAERKQDDLEKAHKQQVEQLETISGLSAEDAKGQLLESLKSEARSESMTFINDIVDEAKLTASKEAKRIVLQTIQRVATEAAIENSVTVFRIENDEMKGRIIGREGRN
ncbi:MAG: Rnase Y domain-containing protein, partial [Bacteroidales bacterium]|nr:Rnase Y domain-containing protein [Bacteroidales bacterium]